LAHLKYLNDTYQLYSRSMIVLAGTSTGGLAAMLWANFVQENAIKSRVYVVADSAVIVADFRSPLTNHTPVIDKATNLFKLINS
jgi:chemotaxis response regulator CheB